MSDIHEIYNPCGRCGATGAETIKVSVPGGEPELSQRQCTECEGSGRRLLGFLSDDLIDFLADMNATLLDIKEKVFEE